MAAPPSRKVAVPVFQPMLHFTYATTETPIFHHEQHTVRSNRPFFVLRREHAREPQALYPRQHFFDNPGDPKNRSCQTPSSLRAQHKFTLPVTVVYNISFAKAPCTSLIGHPAGQPAAAMAIPDDNKIASTPPLKYAAWHCRAVYYCLLSSHFVLLQYVYNPMHVQI